MLGIDERRQFFGGDEGLNFVPGRLGFAGHAIERNVQRSLASARSIMGDSSLRRSESRGARSWRDCCRARHLGR